PHIRGGRGNANRRDCGLEKPGFPLPHEHGGEVAAQRPEWGLALPYAIACPQGGFGPARNLQILAENLLQSAPRFPQPPAKQAACEYITNSAGPCPGASTTKAGGLSSRKSRKGCAPQRSCFLSSQDHGCGMLYERRRFRSGLDGSFRDWQLRRRTLDKRGALANPAVTKLYSPDL
ncbi:hypothetical protein, partial [Mesorhizobium sp.]|uniref:hypothetical protein n=1 Tax=Mesorhizobium sp. TaxID=1871066 RepID=UPI0025DB9395